MRRITELAASSHVDDVADIVDGAAPADTLTLDFDGRRKSRQRVTLDSGVEAALMLARGTVLREGDRLRSDDGAIIVVQAAPELLSVVDEPDRISLARAAYHLGNRHLPVEITATGLQYQHDHVLDEMVRRLGLTVRTEELPFQPEGGAYAGGHGHGGHGHAASDSHDHDHDHDHDLGAPPFVLAPRPVR